MIRGVPLGWDCPRSNRPLSAQPCRARAPRRRYGYTRRACPTAEQHREGADRSGLRIVDAALDEPCLHTVPTNPLAAADPDLGRRRFQKTLCVFLGLAAGLGVWFGTLILAFALAAGLGLGPADETTNLLLLAAAALGLYAGWKVGINVGANLWVKQLRWEEDQRAKLGR